MRALFFTDIDGTLTDHNSYCFSLSLRGIELLRENSIPLITVSSKTFEEMTSLLESLDLYFPFAFENGSGIAYCTSSGSGYTTELDGPGTGKLMAFLPELERITGKKFKGITEFTDGELSEMTGLDIRASARAKKRLTTLPFIAEGSLLLSDSEISDLNSLIAQYGITITKGGRFNHLLPAGSGKGRAVKKIIEFYRDKFKDEIRTAAAGDSFNDIPMLESVDYPYIIRKPDGDVLSYRAGRIMNSAGPAGFSEAVADFLNNIAG